ncbi:MAG: hypothetical protein V5A39_05345 [Haloarculaceae archaeon]
MSTSRGQTTLDFTIGISVFLAVLVFVFAFVPGLLSPFTASSNDAPALADRTADRLAQGSVGEAKNGALGHPEEPYVLNGSNASIFFGNSTDPSERLDLPPGSSVNVTIEGNLTGGTDNSILCWDGNSLDEPSCSGSDTRLATGSTPPSDNDATVTSRRVVSIAGEDVNLVVVVW